MCVRSFSLFPAFHHLPALSRPCPSRYLGSSLAVVFLVLLFLADRALIYEKNPTTKRYTVARRCTMRNIDVIQERGASTTHMYMYSALYMYNDNLSFLLVHPICRSIDLSVGLYRASLHDDKFQLTLINFLLCRRRSNFCHIEAWYDKVIRVYTYARVHAHAHIHTHICIK